MILYIGLFILLIPCGIYDWRTRLIPVWYVGIFSCLAVLYHLMFSAGIFLEIALGAGMGLLFVLISRISKGSLGMGDAVVITAVGLWCGIRDSITIILFAFIMAGFAGGIWMLFRMKNRRESMPFVPFLLLSCLVSCTAAILQGTLV